MNFKKIADTSFNGCLRISCFNFINNFYVILYLKKKAKLAFPEARLFETMLSCLGMELLVILHIFWKCFNVKWYIFFLFASTLPKDLRYNFLSLQEVPAIFFYIFVSDSGDSYRSSSQNDLDSSAVASI